jgi:hypothetical protein
MTKKEIVSLLTEKLNEGQMQDYELHEETVAKVLKELESQCVIISYEPDSQILKLKKQLERMREAFKILAICKPKVDKTR